MDYTSIVCIDEQMEGYHLRIDLPKQQRELNTIADTKPKGGESPGCFSEGFKINVLPHVTAIGNICKHRKTHQNYRFFLSV